MSRSTALWIGVLAGPIIWLTQFEINFILAPLACAFGWKWVVLLIMLVSVLAIGWAGLLSWRVWSAAGKQWPEDEAVEISRVRLMAVGGVILSAGFAMVVIAQSIPTFILGACQ